jgi:D-amino peptidase
VFLGYHAKYGTAKATFDHTFMGASINKVRVNSVEVSEFLINAYAAGEMGVPVILVAGDAQLLADDVKKHAPWAETVALKRSLSRVSARSFGMPRIEKDLKKAVDKAAVSFRKGKAKTLLPEKPVKIEVTFVASHFADIAELSPTVKRTDGLNVEYVAKNFVEAYKTFELLSLASSAMVSILENQV